MSILTNHEIYPGNLFSATDVQAINSTIKGETVPNPLIPPLVEVAATTGGNLIVSNYIYSYSWCSWRVSNGSFEIVEETERSPETTVQPTSGTTNTVRVYFELPQEWANGVIIYRNDGADTKAVAFITDLSTDSFVDTLATASRGKAPISINTFQVGQPLSGLGAIGPELPYPVKFSSSKMVIQTITSASPLRFDREEDFLLFNISYTNTLTTSPLSSNVITLSSSTVIWGNESIYDVANSRFAHPIPIPYNELGISVSDSSSFNIYGYYTGIRRGSNTASGNIVSFIKQVQGPYLSPAAEFVCPIDSYAIIVWVTRVDYTSATNTNDGKISLVILADSVATGLNTDNTYIGSFWRLPPARTTSPSAKYAGGKYGAWNRDHWNPMETPVVLDSGETLTVFTKDKANIIGYIVKK